MTEFVLYKLLDLINRNETIGTMLKIGYSYSNIATWYSELEKLKYIYKDEDSVAKQWINWGADGWRLDVANEVDTIFWMKYENKDIGKLEQFKIKPMLLEEIYLP